jgi:hypothetical protein
MTRNAFLFVVCVAATCIAAAQNNLAVVRGSILDPQHKAIPASRIHLTAIETGAAREVVANAAGLYEIAGLQPGAYTLTVDAHGFRQSSQSIQL